MLSKTIAEQALAAALRTGGDFAEIFYEDTRSGVSTSPFCSAMGPPS